MLYYMGIDGGGTHLRIVIVDEQLRALAQYESGTANPNHIGRVAAAEHIRDSIHKTLDRSSLSPESIAAVGIGIAGASAAYARDWLLETVALALPSSEIVPSSDVEIALVGAHGRPEGVLLLSGTGSVAYGINASGESFQSGGWGYLLGDEGSGYWIGMEALRYIVRHADGRTEDNDLSADSILTELGLNTPHELLLWLYREKRISQVASLAPYIMELAENDSTTTAHAIIEQAATELEVLCHAVARRLRMQSAEVAFAGGLLENNTLLSRRLTEKLTHHYTLVPTQYSPVIGAAILAKTTTG